MPEKERQAERPSPDRRGRYVIRPEWLRSDAAMNGGLIVIGIYLAQSLIASSSEDLAARVSIVAWAIALPLLAVLALLNLHQQGRRYASFPIYYPVVRSLAQFSAIVGVATAFWHAWMPAGAALIASGVVAFTFYAVYFRRIERDNRAD